ncbi:hypothetical protein T484DRAFT_1763080 [Baffinella frigidus]|nr:hypothetical protein T484DRAFT_1763080 [Cryptophyta sp. CCMP2293]
MALRDGREKEVMAQAGKRVPADCRILEASPDLSVELQTIGFAPPATGPRVLPRNAIQAKDTVGVWEASNLVFFGCRIERGSGKAVVIKTGVHTALGVLAREMDWVDAPPPANLTSRIGARRFSVMALAGCGVDVNCQREMDWVDATTPANLSARLDKFEAAFEGRTEAIFRSCGLVTPEGRCRLCTIQ